MGNCFSRRRQTNALKTQQIILLTPLEAIPAAQTLSPPLQTISTLPEAISTPPRTLSAPLQTQSTPHHGQTDILNAPDSLAPANLSMFSNAENINIKGGSYNNTVNTVGTIHINAGHAPLASLDILYRRVAPHAILNTGGRADEVRCHPGTREEVIDRIEKWADALNDSAAPIFWLSGPAGAGKSAIIQTVAERCKDRKVPQVNFFFFRADTSRSTASPLIPTLLHQLTLLYPSLRDPIATVLSTNPLIFDSPIEDQLVQLLIALLHSVQQSSNSELYRPLLILIDGLDECDSESKRSQRQILYSFDKVLQQYSYACPFRLLVASRDESEIQAAFNQITSACTHLYLNDDYYPENDINIFVNDKFTELRKMHPLAHTLAAVWPSSEDINYIVKKSSGHFIYAAIVMSFLLESRSSPKLSLERVKGAAQLATKSKSPFSHLDAIYTYILTQVEDKEAIKDILQAQLLITKLESYSAGMFLNDHILPDDLSLIEFLRLYNPRYTKEVIISCIADVTSIVKYQSNACQLLFYHASFSDFLLDQSRSGEYFVDLVAFNCKISPIVWKGIQDRSLIGIVWEYTAISTLLELQTFPPGLLDMLALSNQGWHDIKGTPNPPIFNIVHTQCITDNDTNNLRYIIRQWIDTWELLEDDFSRFKTIPFASRYSQMAHVTKHFKTPDMETMDALGPVSDFDYHESTIWLNDLLHSAYREIYSEDSECYYQLLRAWIHWAKENGIPCHGLKDLPGAQKYIEVEELE